MFWHNFVYSLKTLFKSKSLIFWTFVFPILLGTFFKLAFSNIEKNEVLEVFNIAVVNNEEFKRDEFFNEALKSLSTGENRIFNVSYLDQKKSEKLLDDNEITGYLLFTDDDIKINVNNSGINETVLRYVVDEINSKKTIINNVIKDKVSNSYEVDYGKIYEEVLNIVNNDNDVKLNNVSNKNLSYTMVEFYSLIAMACLYGSMLSMYIINYKLPDMKSVGKRIFISPINKSKTVISSLLASYVVQIIGIALLFLYTIFILNVDYGNTLYLSIILALVGSLSGLSLGLMVATLIKANEGSKIGILISITMLFCFLSGMMGVGMKYVIDTNASFLNKINPVAMITDGFYSLYYYDTLNRFYFDLISLLVFSLILIIISILALRRQKYDNI